MIGKRGLVCCLACTGIKRRWKCHQYANSELSSFSRSWSCSKDWAMYVVSRLSKSTVGITNVLTSCLPFSTRHSQLPISTSYSDRRPLRQTQAFSLTLFRIEDGPNSLGLFCPLLCIIILHCNICIYCSELPSSLRSGTPQVFCFPGIKPITIIQVVIVTVYYSFNKRVTTFMRQISKKML